MNFVRFQLIILLLFIFSLNFSQESKNQFYLKAMLGIQGAQIDGDYYTGYNQAGLIGGFSVCKDASEKNTVYFSLLFSQKGARQNANPEKNIYDFYRASLNYVELPLGWLHQYKHFDFNFGLYYARLFSAKERNQNGDINTGFKFKNNDLGYFGGIERKFNEKFSGGVRFAYSLIPIRDYFFNGQIFYYNIISRLFNRGLYNNTLSFYLNYNIRPINSKKND